MGCYHPLSLEKREDVPLSHTEGKDISQDCQKATLQQVDHSL